MSQHLERMAIWQAFVKRWPRSGSEGLDGLTLETYTQPEDKDSLSGWVKTQTDGLGWRPTGGTGLDRIGICALPRVARDRVIETYRGRKSCRVDERAGYLWMASLGDSVDEAFRTVKARVLQLASAAERGDTDVLSEPVLHPDVEWKLFFLYQDPGHPVLLPADTADESTLHWYRPKLRRTLESDTRVPLQRALLANRDLMAVRNGQPLFDYVNELQLVARAYDQGDEDVERWPFQPEQHTQNTEQHMNQPLNQILFGPPGTGKTFSTVDAALAILDPAFAASHAADRLALKERFDELVEEGRIRFTTFHQSFSYEDFVEGIRAQSGPEGLSYSVEAGVFKQLCESAGGQADVEQVLEQFLEEVADKPVTLTTPTGKPFEVSYQGGNQTVACRPAASTYKQAFSANIDHVRLLLKGQEPKRMYCESYVRGIVNHLRPKVPADGSLVGVKLPYVLVIDEINRGNVSRIFGELITLIEPSKRQGASESLPVTLPYSRESFSVPDNVYLIGTMNTADRSLAGLDVALRRRFVFKEMQPRSELLDGVKVHGVDMGQLLRTLNERIEALLDREHCLGHAYFMPLKGLAGAEAEDKLAEVFANQVLPLLQEYFFDDWQRIQWVLNDHRKPEPQHRFVQDQPLNVAALFGVDVPTSASSKTWRVNAGAFALAASYQGVLATPAVAGEQGAL